jgi:CheY-like chemotaxis protein
MSTDSVGTAGKIILVVDDNEIVIKTISLKLQGAGYKVLSAMDGTEAVSLVRREKPDLILLDLTFPPEIMGVPWDGFRIMQWFGRLEAARQIPILVITGNEDPKMQERASKFGAVAFFHKPLDHDDLLKTIRETLAAKGKAT